MAIYELTANEFLELSATTFAAQGVKERQDIQRLLRSQIDVIAPDTLVIAEEFGEWEESRRRIDLLAIDKAANLVVIELKRTEDGGHMELQAIRYAAMVAPMTFSKVVEIFQRYLADTGSSMESEQTILDFLDWELPDEDAFAQDVRVVLAAAEFSKEITSSVLWLNDKGLDIRCVRLRPYSDGAKTLVDVQTVIPLPETEQYQVQIREKKLKERESRAGTNRDYSKYDLTIGDETFSNLAKRHLMFQIVKAVINNHGKPEEITSVIPWRSSRLFASYEGELDEEAFQTELMKTDTGGKNPRTSRFFCNQDELFFVGGNTYAFSNQWGNRTLEAAENLCKEWSSLEVTFSVSQ